MAESAADEVTLKDKYPPGLAAPTTYEYQEVAFLNPPTTHEYQEVAFSTTPTTYEYQEVTFDNSPA